MRLPHAKPMQRMLLGQSSLSFSLFWLPKNVSDYRWGNYQCLAVLVAEAHGLAGAAGLGQYGETWWGEVVELVVEGRALRRLQSLERLTKLEAASFASNEISRIQGLASCTALQELSLQVIQKSRTAYSRYS